MLPPISVRSSGLRIALPHRLINATETACGRRSQNQEVLGKAFAGFCEALRCADVKPLAIVLDRTQAAGCFGAVEKPYEREDPARRIRKEPAMQQLDAGKQIRGGLAPATPAGDSAGIEKIIALSRVSDRRRCSLQQQDGVGINGVERVGKAGERGFPIVEPNHVTINDKEDLTEERQTLRNSTPRIEQLVLLG